MNQYLTIIKEKFARFNLRERLLITVSFLAIIYVIWQPLVTDKIAINKEILLGQKASIERNITILKKRYDTLLQSVDTSKVSSITNRINKLRNFNKGLEAEIVKFTKKLIPPNKILSVLQEILQSNHSVKILKLNNLPETPLFQALTSKKNGETVADQLDIYKHGISIELEGRFFDIMIFLYQVEHLDWNIIWDGLEYEVKEYPTARAKIVIYTLSLSSNWLGFE